MFTRYFSNLSGMFWALSRLITTKLIFIVLLSPSIISIIFEGDLLSKVNEPRLFLKDIILKFRKIESSSRLKVTKFSLMMALPSNPDISSLFLKSNKINGTRNVNNKRQPLERPENLNIKKLENKNEVHSRYIFKYSSRYFLSKEQSSSFTQLQKFVE